MARSPYIKTRPLSALPLSAVMLAASMSSMAQTEPAQSAAPASTLGTVTVRDKADQTPESKQSYQAVTTNIGKGKQALRDIPQSVTILTEKLMDDRNLDDLKELLRTTAGITFQAGETGEEDVRLRGFSLSQAGDIYVDGLRDPSLYERDTFNHDRIEVLKGSASMLFGRGSTGGVVNQVSKQPFLMTQHDVETTLGTGSEVRLTGDFNVQTGESSAMRLNVMVNEADNSGASVSKLGITPTVRWGIGTSNEFSVGLFHLEYDNNPIYNHPWFLINGKITPALDADNFYGLASDYNKGSATYATLSHTHRLSNGGELKTTVRHGTYERNLWASVIRFTTAPASPDAVLPSTGLSRSAKGRISETDVTTFQSDFSKGFDWLGMRHDVITGVDYTLEDAKRANNFAGTGTRPNTTVGTPNDGAVFADPRGAIPFNTFRASSFAVYAQNLIKLTPEFKLLAGLRSERFSGSYQTAAGVSFSKTQWMTSHRIGAIYQPNTWASFHVATGSSFNTSGDTYQFAVQNPSSKDANTPAEKSRNIEIGTKLNLLGENLSVNASVFRTEKYNERNTDPDSAATQQLLSGKRHATGLDIDIAGRITPNWEAYLSYTWIPEAKIDESNVAPGNVQYKGDRPGLTPKHSASVWSTYKITPSWRVGAGLNHRGEQNPEGNRNVTSKAFTTLDLMAEYAINPETSLKLNITNATDKLYADSLYRGFYTPGAPRTAQLTLKTTF